MPSPSSPTGKLSEFLNLVDRMDAAHGDQKNEVQRELNQFISSCSEAERQQMRQYFESLITHDETVESARRVYRSKLRRIFNAMQVTVGAVALPIARLSQNTVKLVAATIGLSIVGLAQGIRTAQTFHNAA